MAGIPGALTSSLRSIAAALLPVLVFAGAAPRAARAETEPARWYAPIPVEGKVFPVLRSASLRWLVWHDNFGVPRVSRDAEGVWQEVGRHEGSDIFAETGAPLVSLTSGAVERAGWTFFSGWRVGIRGEDGRYYFYAHLDSFAQGLGEGLPVAPGQVIGHLGSSGNGPEPTSGNFPAHLHLGIQSSGEWENPGELLRRLYDGYVTGTRETERRILDLERRARLLRARAYGPAAPPLEALLDSAKQAEQARVELESTLYLR